jgi:predicted glycoside hydrolase/deacetylase ChbG (UPF0249 family)
VRYCSTFYGQWDGTTHLDQISIDGLIGLLQAQVTDGVTELGCHPGYCDPELRSSYRTEREAELRTLCHPRLLEFLSARQIQVVNFAEASTLIGQTAGKAGRP